VWKEFLPNGKGKWEGTYVDGRLQGVVKTYDDRGGLKDMTKYDAGRIDSTAQEKLTVDIRRSYHPNGKVASLGSYSKSGSREGLFREFDSSGKEIGAKIYVGDRLVSEGGVNEVGAMEGHWVEYFATGEKRAEGEYKNGKREGEWTFYHRSGKTEQVGKYQNGLPQGKWQWFYENGRLHREEFYRRGREDGTSVEYDEEGKVITQGEYIDGLKDGKWFYEVGDHKEVGAYKDGLKDGPWVYTYDNGQRHFTGEFVNGEPHGKHKWYWPNGRMKLEGRYSMGLEQGDFTHYNEYGYPVLVIRYKDGAEIKVDGERLPPPYFPGEGDAQRP
jgi:antitoxin component YwqK of YwqJK toxin-antitoxin module